MTAKKFRPATPAPAPATPRPVWPVGFVAFLAVQAMMIGAVTAWVLLR